jgi:hypothetical protein
VTKANEKGSQVAFTHRPCPWPPGRRRVGDAHAAGRTNVDAVTTPVSGSTRRQQQARAETRTGLALQPFG